ncbi:transposase domain-containing protein [Apostichopus japonicus]|uniref:Transposase domain-containing protein n=1 Tax=Stichopus japonicus TaxID=307972 RepID=A0A2G8JKQ7_STIJA|nr:transposase domain-containing protein [Apostichopus japonicus]
MAYVKPISYWKIRRNVQFQLKHHPYLKIDKSKVPKQIQEPSNLDIPVTNTALNFTSSPTVSQTGHDNVRLSTRPSESKHLFNNTLNNPGVTHRPSSNSESEFEELSQCSSSQSDVDEMSLSDQLGEWATSNNISQTAVSSLLNILKPYHIDLPKDPRSLLKPIKDISFENIAGGKYYHFGIANYIKSKMQLSQPCKESISIKINIDGLPLFRSSNMQFWPILGITDQIFDSTPFPIGIFSGMSKPSPVNEFLKPLIDEVTSLEEHGIEHCGAKYQFSISAVICDAPARALIKRVKGHSSYKGCDRCIQTGTWMGKMVYKESADSLRTDESFQQMLDEDHHLEQSPFSSTSIGLVSQFPLVICIWCVWVLLVNCWVCG